MRVRVFLRLFASLIKILAVLLLVPGAVAAFYGETGGVIAFAIASLITLASGIILGRISSMEEPGLKRGFCSRSFGLARSCLLWQSALHFPRNEFYRWPLRVHVSFYNHGLVYTDGVERPRVLDHQPTLCHITSWGIMDSLAQTNLMAIARII